MLINEVIIFFFFPPLSSGTRKVNLTSWHHDKGQANLSNMTFNDGKLIVNQDGFYYLYANICFRHHETSGNLTKRGLQLMVYMTKTNLKIRRSDVLMKGGSTKYWSGNSEFHFYSVNVGGFFKLKSGEMISIQVSNPLLLDSSQEATYFGAFKVRDLDWIFSVLKLGGGWGGRGPETTWRQNWKFFASQLHLYKAYSSKDMFCPVLTLARVP